jgi:hypothetical protein
MWLLSQRHNRCRPCYLTMCHSRHVLHAAHRSLAWRVQQDRLSQIKHWMYMQVLPPQTWPLLRTSSPELAGKTEGWAERLMCRAGSTS